jgi:dUTP pyrophosphatase
MQMIEDMDSMADAKQDTMEEVLIHVEPLSHHQGLPLPRHATAHSSGLDLCAAVDQSVCIHPGQRMLIPTGLRLALPPGVEGQIRPRSGMALRDGVTLLNSPGTIDADYRGEVKILLVNLGQEPYWVHRGDRIAQLIIQKVLRATLKVQEELKRTERDEGGFGHTGR